MKLTDIINNISEEERLFHGTSHKFNKFSTYSIGNGTGAQALGWGLYFTTEKSVAITYANSVKAKHKPHDIMFLGGKSLEEWGTVYDNAIFFRVPPMLKTKEDLQDYAEFNLEMLSYEEKTKDNIALEQEYNNFIKALDDIQSHQIEFEEMWYVYEVIAHKGKKPNEYRYLDLNASIPNSQIKLIFDRAVRENRKEIANMSFFENIRSGTELYNKLKKHFKSDKNTSLFLLRAGIDGNKSDNVRILFDENSIVIDKIHNVK